ncbi:MAG TPA: 5-formyltetrahydrofolate cyclo-ligase [Polyangia bacterium]
MAPLSSSDVTEDKRALRREMGARRAGLPESERRARSEAASAQLLALPELGSLGGRDLARTVAGYVAAKGEIDPASALAGAAAGGATVALPRVADGGMRFHRADWRPLLPERFGPLVPGRFGLLEPAATAPEIPLEALDVVIVPGLAFDAEGRRVGFGGGYYDGVFGGGEAGRKRPALIGLCYDFQIVPRCPAAAGDVPVDVVVTEARVLRPAGGAQ